MATLYWLKGLRGPEVQVDHLDLARPDETIKKRQLSKHKLPPEHAGLSLADLVKFYPPPVIPAIPGDKIILPGASE